MVSKVAVIALVAILAVPILLGYALNLEETTHNDYEISGDPLNVTKMLENDRYYESVKADQYTLNTSVSLFNGASEYHIVPIYQKTGTETSSFPFKTGYNQYWTPGTWTFSNKTLTYMAFNYSGNFGEHVEIDVYSGSTVTDIINRATYVYYDKNTDTINYSQFNSSYTSIVNGQLSGGNYTHIYTRLYGMNNVPVYWGVYDPNASPESYVDFSAGFRFLGGASSLLDLPDYTNSFIVTINLDSMLNANDRLGINGSISSNTARITKITTNGEVQYYIEDNSGNRTYLYYDPNRSDNTYQMYYQLSYVGEINGTHHYNIHTEFRYIGGWPTYIGEAPYYLKYELDADRGAAPGVMGVQRVYLTTGGTTGNNLSAIMRMDTANFTGFMYNSIHDNVYNPGEFRTNPATTITNIRHFGASLTFGGTTFIVKDGNITLGDHDFSVRKLVFDSKPVAGGYENRIDGVVISTTATPSTLTFGGHWKADVITDSMELKSYTSTDWTPGQFAWNGLDQNFLMIGLLAALGVFIALGIAYRKVKSALFALLVVCGGAAVLFFTMI